MPGTRLVSQRLEPVSRKSASCFRTDDWDWPESDDPAESAVDRAGMKKRQEEAAERLQHRRLEEARRAVEILERRGRLGREQPTDG